MVCGPLRVGVVVFVVGLVAGCSSTGVFESQAEPAQPAEGDLCAVCGTAVTAYPAWVVQVAFEDGSSAFFDSPRDAFEYLLSRSRYLPEKSQTKIGAVFVTDYLDGRRVDARTAFYVNGSEVHGPTGRQLVPVASLESAESLLGDSPGARIIRYEEITTAVLRTLNRPPDKHSTWVAGWNGSEQ